MPPSLRCFSYPVFRVILVFPFFLVRVAGFFTIPERPDLNPRDRSRLPCNDILAVARIFVDSVLFVLILSPFLLSLPFVFLIALPIRK